MGSPANLETFHGDLLGTVIPSRLQHVSSSAYHVLSSQVLTPSMYLGIPLFVVVVATVVLLRHRGIVVLAASMMGISLVLSLGTVLYVGGHDTHVPLPLQVLSIFPVTEGFQSTRFALYTALFGAAIVAIGVDELHRRLEWSGARRVSGLPRALAIAAPLVLAAIVAFPLLPSRTEPSAATDESPFFTTREASAIPSQSAVVSYPWPNAPYAPGPDGTFVNDLGPINDVLLDQAIVGMRFKLIGGYGWRPTAGEYDSPRPSRLEPSSVQVLFNTAFTGTASKDQKRALGGANLVSDVRLFLRRYDVSTVVVLPFGADPAKVLTVVEAAIGTPAHLKGATVWFGVQRRLQTPAPG